MYIEKNLYRKQSKIYIIQKSFETNGNLTIQVFYCNPTM